VRSEGVARRARQVLMAGDGAGERVVPGRGGVAGRWQWPGTVDWHASVASVVRRLGRRGYNSGPGVAGAGTSVGIL
jgi:hypothetical protein